jgi:hypothetical protein
MQFSTTVIYFSERNNMCRTQKHSIYNICTVRAWEGDTTNLSTASSLCERLDPAAVHPECREASLLWAVPMPSELLCRYSWTLYCVWNLWFSRETGFPIQTLQSQVTSHTKKCKQTLLCFLKLLFSFDLGKSLWKTSTQLLSYPDVNTSWKLSVLSCDKNFI